MIVNVSSFMLYRRIFIRPNLTSYLSSLSCVNNIRIIPQNDQNSPNSSPFAAKIQSLKNELHPQTLIHLLSSTHDLDSSLRLFKWASLQERFRHTADTYHHMIMKLGMVCRVDEMEGFCIEMVKGGFPSSEQVLLRLLAGFVRHRRLDEALRVLFVLNSFRFRPSIDSINDVLGALVQEKKGFQSVLFVYKEMVKASVAPTIETLNYLLEALFDAGRLDAFLDQYKRMRKKGCCPNSRTYDILVSGLVGKGLLDEAFVVLNEALETDCELNLNFFSNILPLLFRMNKEEMGLRLFEKMKASKVVPNASIYEVLITYFSNKTYMDNAISLLNEMLTIDLRPPDCVFVDLVNGFCMLNEFSEAKKLLEDKQVMEPNSYNALIKGYCEAGYSLEAIGLFEKLVEKNLTNNVSWNIIIRVLSENGKCDIVPRILCRMIVSACVPNSETYSALIIGKCKSHKVVDALNMFHHVRNNSWVLDSACYATLVETLCQTRKIQDAIDTFHYMSSKKHTLNLSSLISIMKGLSKLKNGNALLAVFARMVVEGCPLDAETYNILVKSTSENRHTTECALFLKQMVGEGLWPDSETLADSISCLAQEFRVHTILPTMHHLFLHHRVVNRAVCNRLVNGLWREGYRNEARWFLDVMLEEGWVPDATTHGLLMGSGSAGNGWAREVSACEKVNMKDEIIDILSKGFDER